MSLKSHIELWWDVNVKNDFLQRLCWRNPQVTLSTLTPAPRILLCQRNSTFSLMFGWKRFKINHHIINISLTLILKICNWLQRRRYHPDIVATITVSPSHCNVPESPKQLKSPKVVKVHLAQLLGLDDWVSAPQDPPGSSTASTTASPRARPTTPHPSQDLLQLLISFPNLPSDQFRSQI